MQVLFLIKFVSVKRFLFHFLQSRKFHNLQSKLFHIAQRYFIKYRFSYCYGDRGQIAIFIPTGKCSQLLFVAEKRRKTYFLRRLFLYYYCRFNNVVVQYYIQMNI